MEFLISNLRDRPHFRTEVADRIWRAWWRDKGTALDHIAGRVEENLRSPGIPFALVAHRDDEFLGTASVISDDMEERPQYAPWVAAGGWMLTIGGMAWDRRWSPLPPTPRSLFSLAAYSSARRRRIPAFTSVPAGNGWRRMSRASTCFPCRARREAGRKLNRSATPHQPWRRADRPVPSSLRRPQARR